MASIYKRKSSYAVIHYYFNETGKRKQKWESFKTEEQAIRRKRELETPFLYMIQPTAIVTVNDLMEQFFELYGTTHWTYSTAESYASLNRRFVRPLLGALRIDGLTGLDMAMLYRHLTNGTKSQPPICSSTLRDLHKLLKCAFHQAILWGVLERSPLDGIVLPKQKRLKKPTWNEEQVRQAVRACGNDIPLSLAIQFAFACSLRMGELLALRWSDIDFEQNTVRINKTMQRINRSALSFIGTKDIIEALPSENNNSPTLCFR